MPSPLRGASGEFGVFSGCPPKLATRAFAVCCVFVLFSKKPPAKKLSRPPSHECCILCGSFGRRAGSNGRAPGASPCVLLHNYNSSASESGSESWEFESLCPHLDMLAVVFYAATLSPEQPGSESRWFRLASIKNAMAQIMFESTSPPSSVSREQGS